MKSTAKAPRVPRGCGKPRCGWGTHQNFAPFFQNVPAVTTKAIFKTLDGCGWHVNFGDIPHIPADARSRTTADYQMNEGVRYVLRHNDEFNCCLRTVYGIAFMWSSRLRDNRG